MITITDRAAAKVKEIASAEDLSSQGLRLRVVGGGCAGFTYDLYFEDQTTDMDEEFALNPTIIGRYAVFDEVAAGGMATVHFGRLLAEAGFSRTVAIKRLHPQFARDPDFVTMFLDEARLASRIRHPNVVSTLDIVANN